jgi:hypothetical protein
MGKVSYRQTVEVFAGKTPSTGTVITEEDFRVKPAKTSTTTDLNENNSNRFTIPANAVDYPMPTGTVQSAKILYVAPEADLRLKLTTTDGVQTLRFVGGMVSILHVDGVTDISATNPAATPVDGVLFVAGD